MEGGIVNTQTVRRDVEEGKWSLRGQLMTTGTPALKTVWRMEGRGVEAIMAHPTESYYLKTVLG